MVEHNMLKRIFKKIFSRKKDIKPGSIEDLDRNIPEDFSAACYLIGYVEGKGFRVFELPYKQRKNV